MDVNIERINIQDITPADYNPRKMRDEEFRNLVKSMDEFGVVDPLTVNLKNNTIIGGHQRYSVLYQQDSNQELYLLRLGDIGWAFPSTDLVIKDEAHEKALNLALNRIKGEFDVIKLNPILEELSEFNLDRLTGFDVSLDDVSYDISTHEDEFYESDEEDEQPYVSEESDDYDYSDDFGESEEVEFEDKFEEIDDSFLNWLDVYRVGNNILIYGDYTQDTKDELLKYGSEESIEFDDMIKNDVVKVPINYYIVESKEVMEKFIKKNIKFSKKLN
ncbi:MAG: ParB N-terminal domain-containing protein [Paludibacteraceae bacterium]|nr:ParB N-terminal domain-containing protein [Paludibacteraceae bacterium]